MRRLEAVAALTLALAACAPRVTTPPPAPIPSPAPTPRPTPAPTPGPIADNALLAGVKLAAARPLDEPRAATALAAFRASCPALLRRTDTSGLTTAADWSPLCSEAAAVPIGGAAAFFRTRFAWVEIGNGEAFATGYYEPQIRGSRTRAPGFDIPIYGKPADLVRCTRPDGVEGRGRIDEAGTCVLYYDRAAIEDGVLADQTPIAWAADPIELFFLEIQGSGRLLLPDGSVMRLGYADQNGREYVAIGRLLRERNLLPPGGANMKSIVAWMRAQPDGGKALMRENLSYIFFRELTGPGPLGAMNVAVTPRATVAADPKFIPLGAPVWLDMTRDVADGLWIAQDTGGAIKGANRVDTFWGAGAEAEALAGGMSSDGKALLLLPWTAAIRATAQR